MLFQPTLSSHSRTVVHDIPVTVIPRRHWEDYEEPEVPQFDVSTEYSRVNQHSDSVHLCQILGMTDIL